MQYEYLLSGSIAFDRILLHEGEFHHRILPDEISRLNVCFGIDGESLQHGGTAGNISYNASLLKGNPLIISSVGSDHGSSIKDRINKQGLSSKYILEIEGATTPKSWIITDMNNNQITAFSSGSMKLFNPLDILPKDTPDVWLISPENVKTSATLIKEGINRGKEILFDPGQALSWYLEGGAGNIIPFEDIIFSSKGIFVNEYEFEFISRHLELSGLSLIHSDFNFYVKTKGKDGVSVVTRHKSFDIPAATPLRIEDPTGCGDAFRAGFMHGYVRKLPLESCALLGAVMGSFVVETSGGQTHLLSLDSINDRFRSHAKACGLIEYFFEV